jgi:serine/threonine protein kinase
MDGYTIIRKLGSGGQGATHCAIRKTDKKNVVIKLVSASIVQINLEFAGLAQDHHPRGNIMSDPFLSFVCAVSKIDFLTNCKWNGTQR